MSPLHSINWQEKDRLFNERLSNYISKDSELQIRLKKQDMLEIMILEEWGQTPECEWEFVLDNLYQFKSIRNHFGTSMVRALSSAWIKTHLYANSENGFQLIRKRFGWTLSTTVEKDIKAAYSHPGWKDLIALEEMRQEKGVSSVVDFVLSTWSSNVSAIKTYQKIKEWLSLFSLKESRDIEEEWVKQTTQKALLEKNLCSAQSWLWLYWLNLKNKDNLPSFWPWDYEKTQWDKILVEITGLNMAISKRIETYLKEFEKQVSAFQIQKKLTEQLPQSILQRSKKTL